MTMLTGSGPAAIPLDGTGTVVYVSPINRFRLFSNIRRVVVAAGGERLDVFHVMSSPTESRVGVFGDAEVHAAAAQVVAMLNRQADR